MEMDQPVELIQPIQEEQQGSSSEAGMDVEVEAASASAAPSPAAEEEEAPRPAPAATAAGGAESTESKQDSAGQESLAQGALFALELARAKRVPQVSLQHTGLVKISSCAQGRLGRIPIFTRRRDGFAIQKNPPASGGFDPPVAG